MRLANRRPTMLAIGALSVEPGHSVLDLGCGAGDAISTLQAAAAHGNVTGIDHAPEMIARAVRRHPAASFACCRFTEIPFAPKSFDRVLATNVAYFWHEP